MFESAIVFTFHIIFFSRFLWEQIIQPVAVMTWKSPEDVNHQYNNRRRVYLLTARVVKKKKKKDGLQRKVHSMCVFLCKVLFVLFVCQHCTDHFFCFWKFFFLAVTEHTGPAAPRHTDDAPIVYREEETPITSCLDPPRPQSAAAGWTEV